MTGKKNSEIKNQTKTDFFFERERNEEYGKMSGKILEYWGKISECLKKILEFEN